MRKRLADNSPERIHRRAQWMHWLTMAMFSLAAAGAAVYLLSALTAPAMSWVETRFDDRQYDGPRTFQTDGLFMECRSPAQPVHVIVHTLQGRVWLLVLPQDNTGHAMAINRPMTLSYAACSSPIDEHK